MEYTKFDSQYFLIFQEFKKFGIVLNGEKIFIKGVTLMPLDSMSSLFNKKKIESYLDSVININANLIRVFGGAGYMPEEFYSMCDERGHNKFILLFNLVVCFADYISIWLCYTNFD